MSIFISILYFVVFAALLIGSLTLLKKFVFTKVRINKYIPLGIAVALFVYQAFNKPDNTIISVGMTVVIVLFGFWFWDINQTGGPKMISKQKKVVIRAKAKPNRVKKVK